VQYETKAHVSALVGDEPPTTEAAAGTKVPRGERRRKRR
jgi:hypothetical protein